MGDDIDEFARSTRRSQRVRMLIMGLVIASPFMWLGWRCHENHAQRDRWEEEARERNRLSPAEKAELDKLLPEMRVAIQNASKAFAEDVTPAKLGEVLPGDAPCPFGTRSSADDMDQKLGTHYATLVDPVQVYKAGEQPAAPKLKSAARELESLVESIKREDEPTKYHLEQARGIADDLKKVVFVVGERNEPLVLADEYIPGTVRGVAFLYSFKDRKIVCAAQIEVENAAEVKIEYRTSNYDVTGSSSKRAAAQIELTRDLAARTNRAVESGMRAVR